MPLDVTVSLSPPTYNRVKQWATFQHQVPITYSDSQSAQGNLLE
jgi:hypothetical protein